MYFGTSARVFNACILLCNSLEIGCPTHIAPSIPRTHTEYCLLKKLSPESYRKGLTCGLCAVLCTYKMGKPFTLSVRGCPHIKCIARACFDMRVLLVNLCIWNLWLYIYVCVHVMNTSCATATYKSTAYKQKRYACGYSFYE